MKGKNHFEHQSFQSRIPAWEFHLYRESHRFPIQLINEVKGGLDFGKC